MRSFIISIILLFMAAPLFSQVENYNKQWVLGAGLNFKVDFTTSGAITSFWDTTTYSYMDNSHSNICNSAGNLLLATDGGDIYNGNKTIIDNGDTLMSELGYSYLLVNQTSQTSIILPLGDSIYQVICGTWSDTAAFYVLEGLFDEYPGYDQVRYHTVDMTANNYAGKVTKKSRIALDSVVTTYGDMTAVKHGNGQDWWW